MLHFLLESRIALKGYCFGSSRFRTLYRGFGVPYLLYLPHLRYTVFQHLPYRSNWKMNDVGFIMRNSLSCNSIYSFATRVEYDTRFQTNRSIEKSTFRLESISFTHILVQTPILNAAPSALDNLETLKPSQYRTLYLRSRNLCLSDTLLHLILCQTLSSNYTQLKS